ncbi:S8 family serine peptidase [Pseudoflavitalea sp. G-6-1-2]|uniref:S8 family serine peptidase n=1 Tax=Pseudoflavitalea sp. G-6-1-2 TaxID=2728841 RepID=UPI00146AC1D7|nr:S8 family serine peptidase [Pseudoflavitalea sp. G-6-1-2]NML19406.1 S8 family serine peptidase [Pseudoflavitalea sp. G-6-1-2]
MKHFYFLLAALAFFQLPVSAQEKKLPPQLKTATITDKMNIQSVKLTDDVRQRMQYRRKNYVMLRFDRLPGASQKNELSSQGIQLFDYIPGNAYFAELPADMPLANLKKYAVNAVYFPDASLKIAASLQNRQPGADETVAVHFAGNLTHADVLQQLQLTGAQLRENPIQPENTLFVQADSAAVRKIAALPFVTYVHVQALKDVPLNNKSRAAIGISSLADATGRNLQGKQVTIGVGDAGDPTHLDFTGRLINRNPAPAASHGVHTTGTAAGAGLLNPRYMGMAPKATIVSDYFSGILVNTPLYMSKYAMVLTNNSYESSTPGCAGTGEYDALSNYTDAQLFNNPTLLHVFAVGNDGGKTCAPFAPGFATVRSGYQSSKNALVVGAYNTNDDLIAGGSSRGPAKDGRIKPEVMAGGISVFSSTINNGYGAISGTSMASPAVTGSLALLYERYRQLHGGTDPNAGLIKALACNGAEDMGEPGPDYTWGFGKLNARTAVEMLEQNQYFAASVTNGNNNTHTINIPAGLAQLKVLLYWVDPPATPLASTALVNNLDLTVTGTDAMQHHPLILNPLPAKADSTAKEGVDNLNNIEQVVISNPPAGSVNILVNGTNIPSGPQQYFVVYQLIEPSITVTYPTAGETFVPGEIEKIRWSAYDNSTDPFTVEYSGDNGSNWTVLSNSVPSDARFYDFTVPSVSAKQALIRVSRNSTTDVSDKPFTILGQPLITLANTCPGYVNISWPAITDADNYEIMMLSGDSMTVVASTNATAYTLNSLRIDTTCWIAVRALINGVPGRRSVAASIIPSGGTCTGTEFNNDLTAFLLINPKNGRQFTPSQPGTVPVRIRLRNLGGIPTSGPYQLSYQINNGAVITESSNVVIAAGASRDYAFATAENFGTPGIYKIKAWVRYAADAVLKNDTVVTTVKHLPNPAITLNPSFTESFESADERTYSVSTFGLEGLDRADFNTGFVNSRGRTGEPGFAKTGIRSMLLDQKRYASPATPDSATLTFNLSSYNSTDQIWLDFFYKNQGIDFSLPGNRVWIRGAEGNAWLPVFTLPATVDEVGIYKAAPSINITETLAAASPAQTIGAGFQVRLGQQGFTSANTPTSDNLMEDGITYDDIKLTRTSGDVGVVSLVNPSYPGICALTNAEPIKVQIKNYSNGAISNVQVAYELNGTVVSETVSLNAGESKTYQFASTANLSAFQQYAIRAWVHATGDSYVNNDTLAMIRFTTAPVINSFPYLETFESNNGYWYPGGYNSSWEWGKPQKTVINKAANGINAWVTSLNGNYNNAELSYLYSPCFNLTGMTKPVLSFSHISLMEDACLCDNHWMEYSTNDVTWTKLGTYGVGSNWYNHPGHIIWYFSMPAWRESSIALPVTSGRIRFRMVIRSDPGFNTEGVAIDDVHIFDKARVYAGPDIPAGITQVVNGNNWIEFKSGNDIIAAINPQGQNLGSTTVKVFRNTGAVRSNSDQYYLDRNIVIKPATAPSSPVLVRYYFLESESQALINASGCATCSKPSDPYQLGITQYSGATAEENGSLSDNHTGTYQFIPPTQVNIIPYDSGYYAEYAVSHFSEFWLNGGGPGQNKPLPVTLTSFTATRKNNAALLQWETSQEINTKSFTIEKSTNGVHYIPVGTVAAAGNSESAIRYQFTDPMLSNGTNYYRLLITDIDGRTSYSPIRTIQVSDVAESLQVYPNPVVRGMLYIRSSREISNIELTDVTGRILLRKTIAGTQYQLPMQGFAKGVYLLNIYTQSGKKTQRIVNGE